MRRFPDFEELQSKIRGSLHPILADAAERHGKALRIVCFLLLYFKSEVDTDIDLAFHP